MVILSLTPRSYVTEAFDLIYFPFTLYVCEKFEKTGENWWDKYIHKTKRDVFREDGKTLPKKGNLKDFRDNFDELALFKLISNNSVKSVFLKNLVVTILSEKLVLIRNEWAHREGSHSFCWADEALKTMIKLAKAIESDETIEKLKILRDGMRVENRYRTRKLIATPDTLKCFLNKEILAVNEKHLTTGNKNLSDNEVTEALRKIRHSREMLDELKTTEGVVAFFWSAIIYKNDSYALTKQFGITFEEKRDDFDALCYYSEAN